MIEIAPMIAAGAARLAEHPEFLVWLAAWAAAGAGIWLHAVMPPWEGEVEPMLLAALSPM